MKAKITSFLIAILMIVMSCSTANDSNENNINNKKLKAYILIPSTKDTLYYEDLSNKDFFSSKNNIILIKDIFDNPEKYGLSNDNKYSDGTIYTNATGFLVKVADKKDKSVTSKKSNWEQYMENDADAIYQVNGEETICDALMGAETDDLIINDCRYTSGDSSILIKRQGGMGGDQLANIRFMSAGDNVGVTHDFNYYIVFNAKVFTQSSAWVYMFKRAIDVDPVGCIKRLK